MMTQEQQDLANKLDSANQLCLELFSQLNGPVIEQEDDLASKLLLSIDERQKLLDALIADTAFVERAYLEQQLELTYSLKVKAKKVMTQVQSLLHSGKQSQRQVNVYKSIDANR